MISMRLLMLLLRTSPICFDVLVCLHCVQKASHLESVSSFSARFSHQLGKEPGKTSEVRYYTSAKVYSNNHTLLQHLFYVLQHIILKYDTR